MLWGSKSRGFLRIDQSMKTFNSLRVSFKHAFDGMSYIFTTQRNARIHTLTTLIIVVLGIFLKLNLTHWAILVLTFSTVWTAEFINTAIEAVIDLVSPEYNALAKIAKDVGAAAVLISSIFSIIIGLMILGPPLVASLTN